MKRFTLSLIFNLIFLISYSQPPKPNQSGSGFKLFFEKIYLSTDRTFYLAGDNLWYSAFLVNAQTNLLTNTSENLYVEIISSNKTLIGQKIIRLNNGIGSGDFNLSDSIASGVYRLRAYTNWMRNFDDNFVFEKEITIANTNGSLISSSNTKTDKTATHASYPIQNSQPIHQLTFFPEGGSMITDVSGLIAFKAENKTGKGISVKGNIYSEDGTLITAINSSFQGMGRFILKPEQNKHYRAKGSYADGTVFDIPLPNALSSGYGLYIKQRDSSFMVVIKTNDKTFSEMNEKGLSVIIRNKGKICYSSKIPFTALEAALQIPKSGIPGGISCITIYDAQGRPTCERLVNIEDNQTTFSIFTDKAIYKPKEKASVNITVVDKENNPIKAKLTLSVVDAGVLPNDLQSNIVSYLNLKSELRGSIENPNQYFDLKNDNRNEQLDLLLLCSGWRDFVWKHLLEKPLTIKHNVEKGFTISGRVSNKGDGKAIPNSNITLAAFAAVGNKTFFTQTDSLGKFNIDGINIYGKHPIKVTAVNSKAVKKGFVYIDAPNSDILPISNKTNTINEPIKEIDPEFIRRKEQEKQLNHSDTISLKEVRISAKKSIRLRDIQLNEFGYKTEEFTITKADYDYTDLEHFLRHRLNYHTAIVTPNIRMDRTSGEANYKPTYPRLIVNGREMPYTDEDPPELIQDYINVYYGLRMDKIKHLMVKRLVGMDNTNGKAKELFVLFITADVNGIRSMEEGISSVEMQGYHETRLFYKPLYEESNHTRADIRTTIHWEPFINTNEKGQANITFYNADPKTRIKIIAEGITNNGSPIAATANYDIK